MRDEDPQAGTPYRIARQAIVTPRGVPCAPEPYGAIVAINLNSGKKVWGVPHGSMAEHHAGSVGTGGAMVTAGGLLFAASTNDPYLRAYDSAVGKELWRGTLPVSASATPMGYVIAGRQFVVVAAGGHGALGKNKSDQLIAFALPATATAHRSMVGVTKQARRIPALGAPNPAQSSVSARRGS